MVLPLSSFSFLSQLYFWHLTVGTRWTTYSLYSHIIIYIQVVLRLQTRGLFLSMSFAPQLLGQVIKSTWLIGMRSSTDWINYDQWLPSLSQRLCSSFCSVKFSDKSTEMVCCHFYAFGFMLRYVNGIMQEVYKVCFYCIRFRPSDVVVRFQCFYAGR